MPELPDLEVYVDHLRRRLLGQPLLGARVKSAFLVRTFDPPLKAAFGKQVTAVRRMGKRVVFDLEDDLHLVLHLMIAGRLRWREVGAKVPGKLGLAAFDFPTGTLLLTEASPKKRASLHVVRGAASLSALDPGGLEPLGASLQDFAAAVRRESHTVKRSLTDPHLFSGIGNAYSDEILWRAGLSPLRLTLKMTGDEIARLHDAAQTTLTEWTTRLGEDAGQDW